MNSKTVLVTGGAGYIGSHTCKALAKKGFLPIAYDNLCSGNENAVRWGPFEKGDIRDRARLSEVIMQHKPSAIMHFAALAQVGDSVVNPAVYYDNNVLGSFSLLEEARRHGINHMVFSSTAAVYGTPAGPEPISESHALNPINPYGCTKMAMENLIRDYAGAYGLKYAILRYFNAAGADPEAETGASYKVYTHLIPLLMQVADGTLAQIKVFGDDYATRDGTAVRDYIHVTDLADAHLRALECIARDGRSLTLNLGTGSGLTVKEVIAASRAVTGCPIPVAQEQRRAGDPPMLVADSTRAREILGWTPSHSDIKTIITTAWNWRQKQEENNRRAA